MPLRTIIVPPGAEGLRICDFLRTALPGLPESVIRGLFSARDVKLDQRRVSREEILHAGQELKLYIPDAAFPSSSPRDMLDIVYEDRDILLVNKRPGISVESDASGGVTLTELCAAYMDEKEPGSFPPAACHRLDNKTSGLCLFAKNPDALQVLQDAFRNRTLEKEYECLVRGVMKPPSAVCKAWLKKDARRAVVQILDRPAPDARPIVTAYETLESGPVSRLRVRLITGRTHQIRAHLAALGHPVLGDDLYGDREFNRARKARGLKLCAVSLTLETDGRLPCIDGRTFTVPAPF